MSFSSGVKEELSRHQTMARHCQIAEIAAIISMCGGVSISEKESYSLKIQTENVWYVLSCYTFGGRIIKYDRYLVFDGLSMIDAGNNSYLSYLFF